MTPAPTDRTAAELDAATRALIAAPASSLAEVAAAIGVSRTTLHRRYATRADLVQAIAHRAIWQLHHAQAAAGFGDPAHATAGPSFEALTASLIDLAPQLQLVVGSSEVDEPALANAVSDLDAPVLAVIRDGQADGVFDATTPPEWILDCLYALSITAGIRVHAGRLARHDAPALVLRTWRDGFRARQRP